MNGNVLEIGFRGGSGDDTGMTWHWDVAAYYARLKDEILSVDDEDAPGTSLTANIDNTIHAGVEALVGASFAVGDRARIEPLLSFTLNRFSFDDDPAYGNNSLPAAPRYVARGEILYRQGGLYAGPTFDLVGKRFADFANTYEVDAHGLIGLRGGYSAKRWEFFVELRNLADEKYMANVGVLNRANADARLLNPGAPRSAYAGVKWAF
jgi:iron complex outermembrane receptor protein